MGMIKEDQCPEGAPAWLTTFSDLMSLLLTFFVLLLSFSTISVKSFNHAMGALQGALGVLSGEPQLNLPVRQSLPKTEGNLSRAELMYKAGNELDELVKEPGLQGDIDLDESTEGIIIRLNERLFFESGDDAVRSEAHRALDAVGRALEGIPNDINIQGHSDNRPVNTPRFASNWELSGMRAMAVARYLTSRFRIPLSQISITGCSEYRPLAPNNTTQNMSRNRRVEIHVRYKSGKGMTTAEVYGRIESEGMSIRGREQASPAPEGTAPPGAGRPGRPAQTN